MRASHVATALAAFAAGLTAASALHRRAARPVAAPAAVAAAPAVAELAVVVEQDAVVLPFPRPAQPVEQVVEAPAAPARCGDTGGVTKAGAPCAARATSGGRCHHHPLAA
ncbi:hypothetical protein [Geodermatophilus sp. FMUSA9-8]|uniref:hypothetical protein n=1 Tax=Geodermatophilus sp. FMUSA9-8 TaxID=3120155 RepID=UPI00300B85FC